MIALDTNILARFYVDDPNDPEVAKQRPVALRIFTESDRLFVPLTVVLELERVLRAFYGFSADEFARVVTHLLGLSTSASRNGPGLPTHSPCIPKDWTLPMRYIWHPVSTARNF